MAAYRPVCRVDDLPPGRALCVELDGRPVALFHAGGALLAVEGTCLHAGGPLHEGTVEGTVVTCPWHGWRFDLATGACDMNPCVSLRTYAVRVRDGVIEIEG
jgi:nitrite reductase/ring-hydroxylating ferredoxin subunit